MSSALMIGAGSDHQTVCKGDSGGPLVVGRTTEHPVQVGVASFAHDSPWPWGGTCDTAAGFAELAGPQLAWVASQVPSIMNAWGPCTSSYGVPGHSAASYGGWVPGARYDGPMYWKIWCDAPPRPSSCPISVARTVPAPAPCSRRPVFNSARSVPRLTTPATPSTS